jgi:hypothetical protein
MREATVEQYLRRRCHERGALCLKFTSPGRRSVPDRLVLAPHGHVFFVELKAPGKDATPAQAAEHARLRALGFRVWVADGRPAVDAMLAVEFREGAPL